VRFREAGARGAQPIQVGEDQLARPRGDEHRRGIEDVLAGRRAVRLGLALAQRPRERHDRACVRLPLLA